jgi:hypothetical protein
MWAEGQYPIAEIAAVTDSYALAQVLWSPFSAPGGDVSWMAQDGLLPVSTGTSPILARFVPKPADFRGDDTSYLSCLDCFDRVDVDGAALSAALAAEWEQPMRDAQALLDAHPWLTRMTSSLSADEMTVDPRFVLNPDLREVSNVHDAIVRTKCDLTHSFGRAPRELVLPDGRTMDLPSTEAWIDEGWTWETWTADVGAYAAETVEQQGRSGAAIQVTDNREAIDAALADRNGCGCDGTGGGGVGVAGLALIALRRRARR